MIEYEDHGTRELNISIHLFHYCLFNFKSLSANIVNLYVHNISNLMLVLELNLDHTDLFS